MKNKILVLLLLISSFAFAQTGKIPSNGAVTISFITIGGITEGWIRNDQSVPNQIEYQIDSITTIRQFEAFERYNFQLVTRNFYIRARNLTSIGNNDWVEASSQILALKIKARVKTIYKQRKLQCDEVIDNTDNDHNTVLQ